MQTQKNTKKHGFPDFWENFVHAQTAKLNQAFFPPPVNAGYEATTVWYTVPARFGYVHRNILDRARTVLVLKCSVNGV